MPDHERIGRAGRIQQPSNHQAVPRVMSNASNSMAVPMTSVVNASCQAPICRGV